MFYVKLNCCRETFFEWVSKWPRLFWFANRCNRSTVRILWILSYPHMWNSQLCILWLWFLYSNISTKNRGWTLFSPTLWKCEKMQTRKTLLFFLPSQIIIEDDGATDNCIWIRMSCEIEILLSVSAQSAFHTQIINSRADNCTWMVRF